MRNAVSIGLRSVLFLLSFCGLCAGTRRWLRLSRFVAPLVASCGIVTILMLLGMAGALEAGFWALYIGGFALAAWVWIIRRDRPDWKLLLALCAYVVFLVWRFGGCWLSHNDDLSHWGLVARFLLEEHAFPDAQAGIVKFQSYPLGGAAWIYYVSRTLCTDKEGLWIAAQYLWMGLAFLPVLSFIHSHRLPLGLSCVAVFLFLMQRNPNFTTLQVDWLLAFLGIGAVAAVLDCRNLPRTALISAVLTGMAMVLTKSSGIFFAAVIVIVMIGAMDEKARRRRVGYAVLCCACFIAAFALWTIHVRLAYPAGLSSKHAVSISRWSGELHSKGMRTILTIIGKMALAFVKPNLHAAAGWAFIAACALLFLFGNRFVVGGYDRRVAMRGLLGSALAYVVWYILLTLMYVFSMPINEALTLASYPRYISTGLSYMMGLCLIQVLRVFGAPDVRIEIKSKKPFYAVLCVLAALLIAVMPRLSMWERLFQRDTEPIPLRVKLSVARQTLDLPKGSRLLLCYDSGEYTGMSYTGVKYIAKYHFYTFDIDSVVRVEDPQAAPGDTVKWMFDVSDAQTLIDDPVEVIMDALDRYDACVVLDPMDEVDGPLRSRLTEYKGGARIAYSYE